MNKIQRFGFLVMIRNYRRTPVTAVGLDVFEELSTTYEFLVSKAPSGTNLKTKDSHISQQIKLKFQDSNLAGRLQQQGDIEIEDFD